MAKALGDKMMAAERTRPDVIQMSHALQSRALLEGVDLASHLDRFLKDFQDASLSDSRKFSAFFGTCSCEALSQLDRGCAE